MKYDWEIVEESVEKLIEKKEIGEEDKDAAKVCVACVLYGKDKDKIKELADCELFETYWSNLEGGGYFTRGGGMESLEKGDIPFLLMLQVAEGVIIRRSVRKNEVEYRLTEKGRKSAVGAFLDALNNLDNKTRKGLKEKLKKDVEMEAGEKWKNIKEIMKEGGKNAR